MKILYDHLAFCDRLGGVSKYFAELLRRLPRETWELSLSYSDNRFLRESALVQYFDFFPKVNFRGKVRLLKLLNQPGSLKAIRNGNYDLYHQTHYDAYGLAALPAAKRFVMTVHDMNFVTVPQYFKANGSLLKHQKTCVEKADHIICVSDCTKNDLVRYWHSDPGKISVIHLGVSGVDLASLAYTRIVEAPYILYVGTRQEATYKNFDGFLTAFSVVAARHPGLRLVCTGRGFSPVERTRFTSLGIEDIVLHCAASENEMARLYRDAELFVYPSFAEGFGMPILEAFQYGCPVSCSDIPVFREVAGEAAYFFDPSNVESIADAMDQIIDNESKRSQLKLKGNTRRAAFSWEKCMRAHLALYRDLV